MIVKEYLHNFYNDRQLSLGVNLEGGAALSFFYGIEREYSGDLDFTIDNLSNYERFRKIITKPLVGANAIHIDKNQTRIHTNKNGTFYIDYFIAPSCYCEYVKKDLDDKTRCNLHSLNDIFVEKIYCLIQRNAERDFFDLKKIIKKNLVNIPSVIKLFKKKQQLKKISCCSIDSLIDELPLILAKKNWDITNADIYSFIKDLKAIFN